VTYPDPQRARYREALEKAGDHTHTRNLTAGQIADLLAQSGLAEIQMIEEPFTLDFDEWFDRGTPAESKAHVRDELLAGTSARGFRPRSQEDGHIQIDCIQATIRGVRLSI